MDKFEYRIKTEQMLTYVEAKSYKKAMEIADSIDWRKVKNAAMLCTVSEIYEYCGEYQKGRDILFIAYEKSPGSRKVIYRLATLALKLDDIDEATDCYEEFVKLAPKDPNQFILRYKIFRAQNAPLEQQIEVLKEFKKAEYVEKWAYELAKLYNEAGMTAECLEECDDLILWFSEGKYVFRAMDLKKRYKPLTTLQKEKYNQYKEGGTTKALFPADEDTESEESKKEGVEEDSSATKKFNEVMAEAVSTETSDTASTEATKVLPVNDILEKTENKPEKIELNAEQVELEPEAELPMGEEMSGEKKDEEQTSPYVTGQLKIEEILKEWEEKQRENAAKIDELKQQKQETETISQPLPKEPAATVPEEPASRATAPLSDEIRELMEDLENSTEDNAYTEEEPQEEEYAGEEPEEEVENMGTVIDSLHISEDDEDLDAEEDLDVYDDDEYFDEENEDDDYAEELEEYEEDDDYAEDLDEYEEDDDYAEDLDEYEEEDDYAEDLEEYEEDDDYAEDLDEYEDEEDYDAEEEPEKEVPLDLDRSLNIEEPSEEEIAERLNRSKGGVSFDTGFVVQGRYDLSATSEIGLKVGLTEEQKKLFSYFVPIRGVSEQIVTILENDKRGKRRHGTSRTGNITVIGRKGTGKTVLAVDLVKAIQKERNIKQGKVAIITGEAMNKKELGGIFKKLNGGALIIEKAGKLNTRTIKELDSLMEEQTGEMLVILEEQRKPLEKIFAANPHFKKKFTSKIELPIFINDELVTFGQTYAKENGYRIDDMGILALYSRIDVMQREDHAVTVAEVKEIMDEAIDHSQKANVKHLVKRVFGKSTDEGERIILKEDDFKR